MFHLPVFWFDCYLSSALSHLVFSCFLLLTFFFESARMMFLLLLFYSFFCFVFAWRHNNDNNNNVRRMASNNFSDDYSDNGFDSEDSETRLSMSSIYSLPRLHNDLSSRPPPLFLPVNSNHSSNNSIVKGKVVPHRDLTATGSRQPSHGHHLIQRCDVSSLAPTEPESSIHDKKNLATASGNDIETDHEMKRMPPSNDTDAKDTENGNKIRNVSQVNGSTTTSGEKNDAKKKQKRGKKDTRY